MKEIEDSDHLKKALFPLYPLITQEQVQPVVLLLLSP